MCDKIVALMEYNTQLRIVNAVLTFALGVMISSKIDEKIKQYKEKKKEEGE